jgi:putative ABC transport system permease protein
MIRVTLAGLRANKLRFLLTAIAVTLGVAFMAGTQVYSDTLGSGFDDLMASSYDGIDVTVRAPEAIETMFGDQRDLVDVDVADTLLGIDGVAKVTPQIGGYAQLVDAEGNAIGPTFGPPTFGVSWDDDESINPMHIVDGRAPSGPGEVVIDRRSAELGDLSVGDTVSVLSRVEPQPFVVVGLAAYGNADSMLGASISSFTLEEAQRLMAAPGKANELSVVAEDGVSEDALRTRITEVVEPLGLEARTRAEMVEEGQQMADDGLAFFDTFLLVFALIALFVGSFIIFNTFSILVVQRARETALLRAIGASRRQVLLGVLVESVIVATIASAVGLVAGIGLANGLRSLLGRMGLDMPGVPTAVTASSMIQAFLAGFVVTVVAAVWPARRAGSVPPLAAMRDVAVDSTEHRWRRTAFGLTIVALGATTLVTGLLTDTGSTLPIVGAGMAVTFLGVAVLSAVIARPVIGALAWPLPRIRGITGQLARQNAIRNPKRTSATASALMVGVAIVALITIITASAKETIQTAMAEELTADYVVAPTRLGAGFSPELSQRLAALPEVAQTSGVRFGPAEVDGSGALVAGVNPRAIVDMWRLELRSGDLEHLSDGGVAVSTDVADDLGLDVGERLPITFAMTGVDSFSVEAVFEPTEALDDYVLNTHAFDRNFVQPLDMQVYVQLYEGIDRTDALAAIDGVLSAYPSVELLDSEAFADSYAEALDQLLNLVYGLLALAIVIALIGIANTLALSIHERTRELGLLRAVGLSRAQLRAAVRWEAVAISLFGACLGLGLGGVFGVALVGALRDEGITELALPIMPLVVLLLAAWAAGVIASLRPSRRAARLDILRAIAR